MSLSLERQSTCEHLDFAASSLNRAQCLREGHGMLRCSNGNPIPIESIAVIGSSIQRIRQTCFPAPKTRSNRDRLHESTFPISNSKQSITNRIATVKPQNEDKTNVGVPMIVVMLMMLMCRNGERLLQLNGKMVTCCIALCAQDMRHIQ